MKRPIRLTESRLQRIIQESVRRILREELEFGGDDTSEEWTYYQYRLQHLWDVLGVLVRNKVPRNDPDRQEIEKQIKSIRAHLRTLE